MESCYFKPQKCLVNLLSYTIVTLSVSEISIIVHPTDNHPPFLPGFDDISLLPTDIYTHLMRNTTPRLQITVGHLTIVQ